MSHRVNLSVCNQQDVSQQLNFSTIGDLTQPITADWVNIVKISIPNSDMPILIFPSTYNYTFLVSYQGYSFSQNVLLDDRGNGSDIFEIGHIVSMLNTALVSALAGLNGIIPIPTSNDPYISYNLNTSMYSLNVDPSAYESSLALPITISCNSNLYYILQTIPSVKSGSGVSVLHTFLCNQTNENFFEDLNHMIWIKLDQEQISLCNYATPRLIWITTSMPVQSETFVSRTSSANQTYYNVLQSLTIGYSNGVIDFSTNNDFTTVQDRYRKSHVNATGIYSVKCDVYWVDNIGNVYPFTIPPHTSAMIMLDFWTDA